MKAPYSSGKDWSKIEKNLAKVSIFFFPGAQVQKWYGTKFFLFFNVILQEAEEKAEGEAALNEMFQKIYADASDEV